MSNSQDLSAPPAVPAALNRAIIHYCNQCRWMLRSAWLAQELLSTFDGDLHELTLKPGSGGVFEVWLNGELIWERKRDNGFPDAKELKQRVRDLLWPERSLGHIDGHKKPDNSSP